MILSENEYQCRAGETFDSVALIVYKDEKYACELLSANPELCKLQRFNGGERLRLPIVSALEDEGQKYMRVNAPWKE